MIDITELDDYKEKELSSFFIGFVEHEVQRYGTDLVYSNYLKEADCSRTSADGLRLMQTNGFRYSHLIAEIIYFIQAYCKDDEDIKLQELLDLHHRNLEFEKENPPVVFKNNKVKSQNKTKTKSAKKDNTESAAVRKLAIKAGKLSKLSFSFKPIV